MKKLIHFFQKEDSYYSPDFESDNENEGKSNNSSNSTLISSRECKKILKENQKLKSSFRDLALEKFKTRRSIRKFSDQEVEWEIIYKIIEAGLNAPVAGGIQNYRIIVVKKPKEKKELGKLSFQQYWIADAPYILVVIRDNHRLMQLYPSEGEIYSVQNSAALIENILMMAHFYDLGSCWVEAYDNSVVKEFLSIPPEYRVDALIPIGYPLEKPKVSKDPFNSFVFYDKFNNKIK